MLCPISFEKTNMKWPIIASSVVILLLAVWLGSDLASMIQSLFKAGIEATTSIFQFSFELALKIGVLIDYLLGIFGIIFWYLFIFINLLIPQLILLGYLGYKSKPNEEKFNECFNNIVSFAVNQNMIGQKNMSYMENIGFSLFKLYVTYDIKSKMNVLFYDLGVARLAYVQTSDNQNNKGSHIVIGVFGTWIPIR